MPGSTHRPVPGRPTHLIPVTAPPALLAAPRPPARPRLTRGATLAPAALIPVTLMLAAVCLAAMWLVSPEALAAPGRPGRSTLPWRWPLPMPDPSDQSHSGQPVPPDDPAGPAGAGRAPEVTRGFEPPVGPYEPGHRGVDLAAAPGTPVLAAGPGVVGYAGMLAGRGVVTVVHPGGLRTTYEPVRAGVRPGQHVSAGTVLGTLEPGHPGCPRRACLHWGLLRGHTYLDPLSLLRHGPMRLLPLGTSTANAAPLSTGRAWHQHRSASESDRIVPTGSLRPVTTRWTSSDVVAALGLAVAGALALSRRRPL